MRDNMNGQLTDVVLGVTTSGHTLEGTLKAFHFLKSYIDITSFLPLLHCRLDWSLSSQTEHSLASSLCGLTSYHA